MDTVTDFTLGEDEVGLVHGTERVGDAHADSIGTGGISQLTQQRPIRRAGVAVADLTADDFLLPSLPVIREERLALLLTGQSADTRTGIAAATTGPPPNRAILSAEGIRLHASP